MPANRPIPKVVKLDSAIRDRLERLGEIKHRSPHWLMKEAIMRYLEQEEYNEALNRETLARWQEAEQGKVVSHQAISQWLDTWGTDEENSGAAKKAALAIKDAAQHLLETPSIGKPVKDLPPFRGLLVRFGARGYVLRYRVHVGTIYIVHVRHYREADFKG